MPFASLRQCQLAGHYADPGPGCISLIRVAVTKCRLSKPILYGLTAEAMQFATTAYTIAECACSSARGLEVPK